MKTITWAVRKHGGGIYAVTTQTLNARLVLMLVFPLVVGPHSRIYRVIVACILPPHSLCQHLDAVIRTVTLSPEQKNAIAQ